MDDSHVSGVGDDEESDNNGRLDRLSELPDPLIHSILCLLPMKDVVGTTLLSKRWYNLWATVPCLDFCVDTYQFRDFINGAIALWRGAKILKFKLVHNFDAFYISDIDSWLHFAIDKQVQELHLDMQCDSFREYLVPPFLYSCSSITKLTLVGCGLDVGKNVQWNQLESLTIRGTESLSENAMDNILYNAPRLEEFYLEILDYSYDFHIQSSSLKKLEIDMTALSWENDEPNDSVLRISAPNLESLEMLRVPCTRCLLNVPSLTKAKLSFKSESYSEDVLILEMWRHFFQSLNHVEDFTLSQWCIKVLLELKKNDTLVSFSNAKYLRLYPDATEEILGVVEMFPMLMMLVIELNLNRLTDWLHSHLLGRAVDHVQPSVSNFGSLEASPSLLHLRTVEIMWYLPDSSMFGVMEIILKNAKKLEKMVFQPVSYEYNPVKLSMVQGKLFSLPMASPTAQVIITKGLPILSHFH